MGEHPFKMCLHLTVRGGVKLATSNRSVWKKDFIAVKNVHGGTVGEVKAENIPPLGEIPSNPGVYQFVQGDDRVLYVGKAKNLRKRLASYFRTDEKRSKRIATMLDVADSVRWTVTASETDALILERRWINTNSPPYNVALQDSGNYPGVAISDGVARAFSYHGNAPKNAQAYGPWPGADSRTIVDLLGHTCGIATCTVGTFRRSVRTGRACMKHDLGSCLAPCIGAVDEVTYDAAVGQARALLEGKIEPYLSEAKQTMVFEAGRQNYEAAAKARDRAANITRLGVVAKVLTDEGVNVDILAAVEGLAGIGWAWLCVRGGTLAAARTGWGAYTVHGDTQALHDVLAEVANQYVPQTTTRVLTTPHTPLEGFPVRKQVRKNERDLVALAHTNAEAALRSFSLRRSTDLTARSAAARELSEALHMGKAPYRIEGWDISHWAGKNAYGSAAVWIDGKETRAVSRVYKLPDTVSGDDYASMRWLANRRLAGKDTLPDLIIVDGGPEQVAEVGQVVDTLGLNITCVGLAKRLEELWPYGWDDPVVLARGSEGLYLAMRIRDSAHNLAIRAGRKSRKSSVLTSELDNVDGLGRKKAAALLRHFGSVDKVRQATVEQLCAVDGVGSVLAEKIRTHFNPAAPKPAQ